MDAVAPLFRARIVSGMRWTLWLSVLAAPFSYGTSILLARTGPEVVGTYGLLMVYTGVVTSLLYFGGDAVVIKYVPELELSRRLPFLFTYFLVITATVVPWLLAVSFYPRALHYLFGDREGPSFQLLFLCLSPLCIGFTVLIAALKAVLDLQWAQILLRVQTIASFLLYACLFLAARRFLDTYCTALIWGSYLTLTAVGLALGLRYLLRLRDFPVSGRSLGFFLPRGFWKYALSTEQVSLLSFVAQRLDLILILNLGGIILLGKYVAVLALADMFRSGNRLLIDPLMPSLTNLLAEGDVAGASQVFAVNLRLLLLVNMGAICLLLFLAGPVIGLLGPAYASLQPLFMVMVLFSGLSGPAWIGGTLLSSVGKQQRAVWIMMGQIVLYVSLLALLWPRWNLMGAVVANGVALLAAYLGLLVAARYSTAVRFAMAADYAKFVFVGVIAMFLAMRMDSAWIGYRLACALAAVLLFLLGAGYSLTECRQFISCFVPRSLRGAAAEAQD